MEKINNKEVIESIAQPNVIVTHNVDELVEKRKKARADLIILKDHIEDLNILIAQLRDLGCNILQESTMEEEIVEKSISQESEIIV